MLELNLSKQAFKFLKTLKGTKQGNQIKVKIQSMLENPYPNDSIKMKNAEDFHRADIGEYRIIYRVENKSILEIKIVAQRNDSKAYKLFDRSSK
jgi:mRNA interferase RelE/StbE